MADVVVERVRTPAQLDEAFAVRVEVFVGEQRVPPELELDEADHAPTTTHVLARPARGGAAIGTARLLTDVERPGQAHIGRVAVAAAARGAGVGSALMGALERIALAEHAGADGAVTVLLSAQVQAIGFYERLGYTVTGEVYLDAGIDHRDASKVIARA
ncbi:GNAT family N-acetyltransferase [Xylanimonas ulmi]|uniref:Putative GNAT family N-acyltransferase n=1 Tax=Xylanimonas ulmi TaxID=228973 RepID=A0A4Q7M5H5_9MICO|nr:GNAT family N-acetyltransferase [Xylanibacterium ulmi]RZS61279.1 putative GNAT family N-acyltransferase [Xylanibacterium ulmi]